jgi:FAD:protein FMN transferase
MWGTAISVDVRDGPGSAAVDALFEWFRHIDDLFSTWRPDTEISRLGRGELSIESASPEVRVVLDLCDEVRCRSNGAFDVTVGRQHGIGSRPGLGPLDPSGLVKGWAVERAADRLHAEGATRFSINAGGDAVVRGHPDDWSDWRVGIQHPWERGNVAAVLSVVDVAVATSGRYERGDHVFDPRTGLPASGLAAVTVVGADLALADGYATAALALGDEGMSWLAGLPGIEALGITDDRVVITTAGFDRYRVA